MSLKCCNRLCRIIQSIPLYETETQKHRILVVGRCKNPKCGKIKAEFLYYDQPNDKFVCLPIPNNEVADTIRKYSKAPYLSIYSTHIKYGTKNKMQWKYHKNGCIYDFNDTLIERLQQAKLV